MAIIIIIIFIYWIYPTKREYELKGVSHASSGSLTISMPFPLAQSPTHTPEKAILVVINKFKFISLSKSNSPDRVSRLETALVHLTSWFFHNGLSLNPENSEAILLGTHPRNKSLDNITQVDVNCLPIPISDNIKLLGATIDSSLAFNKHVSLICQSCQYHIRALRHIRPILDDNTAKLVGHTLVSSRLDYANSIMYGMSKSLTAKPSAKKTCWPALSCERIVWAVPDHSSVNFTGYQWHRGSSLK